MNPRPPYVSGRYRSYCSPMSCPYHNQPPVYPPPYWRQYPSGGYVSLYRPPCPGFPRPSPYEHFAAFQHANGNVMFPGGMDYGGEYYGAERPQQPQQQQPQLPQQHQALQQHQPQQPPQHQPQQMPQHQPQQQAQQQPQQPPQQQPQQQPQQPPQQQPQEQSQRQRQEQPQRQPQEQPQQQPQRHPQQQLQRQPQQQPQQQLQRQPQQPSQQQPPQQPPQHQSQQRPQQQPQPTPPWQSHPLWQSHPPWQPHRLWESQPPWQSHPMPPWDPHPPPPPQWEWQPQSIPPWHSHPPSQYQPTPVLQPQPPSQQYQPTDRVSQPRPRSAPPPPQQQLSHSTGQPGRSNINSTTAANSRKAARETPHYSSGRHGDISDDSLDSSTSSDYIIVVTKNVIDFPDLCSSDNETTSKSSSPPESRRDETSSTSTIDSPPSAIIDSPPSAIDSPPSATIDSPPSIIIISPQSASDSPPSATNSLPSVTIDSPPSGIESPPSGINSPPSGIDSPPSIIIIRPPNARTDSSPSGSDSPPSVVNIPLGLIDITVSDSGSPGRVIYTSDSSIASKTVPPAEGGVSSPPDDTPTGSWDNLKLSDGESSGGDAATYWLESSESRLLIFDSQHSNISGATYCVSRGSVDAAAGQSDTTMASSSGARGKRIACPDSRCSGCSLNEEDIVPHMLNTHRDMQLVELLPQKMHEFTVDPREMRLNQSTVSHGFLVHQRISKSGPGSYGPLLPVMFVGLRFRMADDTEVYMFWLTGMVPDGGIPLALKLACWSTNGDHPFLKAMDTELYNIKCDQHAGQLLRHAPHILLGRRDVSLMTLVPDRKLHFQITVE